MSETKRIGEVVRPDLSAKMERLKRGLVADTVKINSSRYPSLKGSKLTYSLKSGRFGASDPLRKRSKMFRKAVAKFAPPYYFWHKEYINSMKLKPMKEKNEQKGDVSDYIESELTCCLWCKQMVGTDKYEFHKINRCTKRHQFLGHGFYQCSSCRQTFLNEEEAKHHVSLHFPNQQIIDPNNPLNSQTGPKNLSIICRDQAKRKKWL